MLLSTSCDWFKLKIQQDVFSRETPYFYIKVNADFYFDRWVPCEFL